MFISVFNYFGSRKLTFFSVFARSRERIFQQGINKVSGWTMVAGMSDNSVKLGQINQNHLERSSKTRFVDASVYGFRLYASNFSFELISRFCLAWLNLRKGRP